jgi:threonine aldolase
MDGARLFNAAVALGVAPSKITAFPDTVSFCLSKGLGAPVGGLLCGSAKFIAEARRVRKMLGGGMRQAGILAAAGLYALENNVERLAEDHAHAALIAAALQDAAWASLDPTDVKTNIIFFDTPHNPASEVGEALAKKGIRCHIVGPYQIRMVTSLAVDAKDVERICQAIRALKI